MAKNHDKVGVTLIKKIRRQQFYAERAANKQAAAIAEMNRLLGVLEAAFPDKVRRATETKPVLTVIKGKPH